MRQRRRLAVLLATALLATASACTAAGDSTTPPPTGPPATVRVLTQNLYLGADITRPVRAAQGRTGAEALKALGEANAQLRQVVQQTDFPTRARLLATEIARDQPDLVGLQEAALWRHGPLQLDHLGRLDATEVDVDFLALLQDALAAQGARYDLVASQDESDVEAPAFVGPGEDLRLTMRDAVLARVGSAVQVTGHGSGQYSHRLDVDLGGVPFSFVRGYVWADATVSGRPLRFVTTQLESQSSDVALAQAQELLAGPAAAGDRPVVLGCDCNSDPADDAVAAGSGVPGAAAASLLTGSGLADAWLGATDRPGTGSGAQGATCCRDERLTSDGSLGRRLDLVLARGTASLPVTAGTVQRAGVDPADRDPGTGLWPSDHAGLLAGLRLG